MKKRMTMLDRAIDGRQVLAYVNGQYSTAPQSNLSHALRDLGLAWEDEGTKFSIAVGARRRYRTEGVKMAIVKI